MTGIVKSSSSRMVLRESGRTRPTGVITGKGSPTYGPGQHLFGKVELCPTGHLRGGDVSKLNQVIKQSKVSRDRAEQLAFQGDHAKASGRNRERGLKAEKREGRTDEERDGDWYIKRLAPLTNYPSHGARI